MAEIEKFHFRTDYQVIVDPEFPGDGNWRCPVVGYDRDAAVVDRFEPRWGTPLVLEVEPMAGDRWVGMFEASGLGGTTGVFATPDSARLCAVVDGLAYVVKADDFEDVAAVKWQVHQVMAVEDSPVLLLVSGIDITALGPSGVLWASPRLALDDLIVRGTVGNIIACSLYSLDGDSTVTLDAMTGRQLSGPQQSWPGG